jgi:glycosyltransferase involved in cell wall biosynthesis
MREADVFVLSSHAEPLGVVTMEAMSMGLASVATDAGGVREIMTHERDGLLVPPKDPAALAEALRRLAEDEALRQRLAAAGRRTVVERFDSRHSAGKLFERLTGERPTQMLAVLDSLPEVVEKPVPIESRRQPEGVA